ncbi:MAG TPA: hypothetical protein VGH87_22250 [Polyangiaceae bacterium]|jgi:hypothetical protein|nr:hypothetical protein [Polyangiaceae bacterium]
MKRVGALWPLAYVLVSFAVVGVLHYAIAALAAIVRSFRRSD